MSCHGDSNRQDIEDSPSICTQTDDASEDSRDFMLQDSNYDNHLYEDSGVHDITDEDHINDFAMDPLRDLRLDDEVDSVDGSGGIDDCNRRELTTTTDNPEAVDHVNAASRTFVSVRKSTDRNENHMIFEDKLSRLSTNFANLTPREKVMATTPLRPRVTSFTPRLCRNLITRSTAELHFEADSGCSRPSEVLMARSHNVEPSSKKSWHGNSPFSQRVEMLMATRLAAGSGLTNSVTGTEIEIRSSVPADKNIHLPIFATPHTGHLFSRTCIIRIPINKVPARPYVIIHFPNGDVRGYCFWASGRFLLGRCQITRCRARGTRRCS